MAEKKAAAKAAESVVLTENNIIETLEKGNRAETALTEQMLAEVNKEKDERLKEQLKCRYLKATYQRDLALIQRRRSKKDTDLSLYKIRQAGRLLRFLTGFDVDDATLEYAKTPDDVLNVEVLNEKDKTLTIVTDKEKGTKETFKVGDHVPALLTIVAYDDALKSLNDNMNKKRREIDAEYEKHVDLLEVSYHGYYHSSWRW